MKTRILFVSAGLLIFGLHTSHMQAIDVSGVGLPSSLSSAQGTSAETAPQDHEVLAHTLHESHLDAYQKGYRAGHTKGFASGHQKGLFTGFTEGIKHARRKVGELFTKAGEHIHNWADNIKTGTEHMYENAKRFWAGKSKGLAKDIGAVEGELSDDMDVISHNISPF
ncbi:MAG: hypothetical protein V6Z78_04335 [Holosporaceae bacterium]